MLRRWLPVAGRAPLLLTRRSSRGLTPPLTWMRRSWSSPEQCHSVLLLRLQRHGIDIPHVLAMGQRHKDGLRDSFLLTAPRAALRLDLWLRRQQKLPTAQARRERQLVLREAGATFARLHQACCYLAAAADVSLLAVRLDQHNPAVTLVQLRMGQAPSRP